MQRSGLATAARTEEGEKLACRDREGNPTYGPYFSRSRLEAFRQVLNGEVHFLLLYRKGPYYDPSPGKGKDSHGKDEDDT